MYLSLVVILKSLLLFLKNVSENTISLWKRDLSLVLVSNDNDIRGSSSELMTIGISNSDQIVVSIELINGLNDSNSSDVVTLGAVSNVSDLHFVNGINSSSLKVKLNSVLNLNLMVKELEGSSVVSDEITDLVWTNEFLLDSAEFEVLLGSFEWNQFESSFDIVEDSEGFVELWNINNVHESAWVLWISSDFLIDVEKSLLLVENGVNFSGIEGNAKFVSEDNLNWD